MRNILIMVLVLFGYMVSGQTCSSPPSYNDPNSQYGVLEAMNIPCAWTLTSGNSNVITAVMDRYLDDSHYDLAGKIIDIHGNCNPAYADNNHGIQSFGSAVGIRNNGICIAGSGGNTRAAGYCSSSGANNSNLLDAKNRGYDIISISAWSSLSRSTMETVTSEDIPVLVAGLNTYHQNYYDVPGVIHVGRCKKNGDWVNYTTNGTTNQNLDLLVVTEDLHGIKEGNLCGPGGDGIDPMAGTSIGTPLVAGVVALMKSVNPCLSAGDIEEILVNTADPIPSNANSSITRAGKMNAYAAVLMAQSFSGFNKSYGGTQIIINDNISGDLLIKPNANITFTGNVKLGNNSIMRIKYGAKVTLTGTFEMGDHADIIIERGGKLIVDGGLITTRDCANQWSGIFVEGYSNKTQKTPLQTLTKFDNGAVHIKNGSTIENAWTALSTNAAHISYPAINGYRGGVIWVENSTIKDCWRAIEFMKYNYTDKSKFVNSTFSGQTENATHWAVEGVTYDNCTFSTYDKFALSTTDAGIIVKNDCDFNNQNTNSSTEGAIIITHTFSGTKTSEISGNDFNDGYHHVLMNSPYNTLPIIIENNDFNDSKYGIYILGEGYYLIENNRFNNQYYNGITVSSTEGGLIDNTAINNIFTSCGVSIFGFYDNSKFEFLSNCFTSDSKDVRLSGNNPGLGGGPGIFAIQGSDNLAASNDFYSSGSRKGISLAGTTQTFNYYIKSGTPLSSSKVPPNFGGNMFNSNTDNDCGSGTFSANPSVQLRDGANGDFKNFLKEIRDNKDKKDYNTLKSKYKNKGFAYEKMIHGLMLSNGDYGDANMYLSQIKTSNEKQKDYIYTQSVNLLRLTNPEFMPSSKQLKTLRKIAEKQKGLDGYARSLFYVLTGELIEPDHVEGMEMDQVEERNQIEQRIKIFPNPANDFVNISLNGYANNNITINLYSISGLLVQSQIVSIDSEKFDNKLDFNGISKGTYLLLIRDKEGGLLKYEKLIKL